MPSVTRFWFVHAATAEVAVRLPAELATAGVVSGPGVAVRARALAETLGTDHHVDADLEHASNLLPALGRWAQRFGGKQCVLLGPAEIVNRAVGEALGVGEGNGFELRPGGCAAVDWPVGRPGDAGAPPALIGFDLDWCPAFVPTGRPRFPGGPGVAPSGRA